MVNNLIAAYIYASGFLFIFLTLIWKTNTFFNLFFKIIFVLLSGLFMIIILKGNGLGVIDLNSFTFN